MEPGLGNSITSKQMYDAEKYTIDNGISADQLMENAGEEVFKTIQNYFSPVNVLVLCGPGNNGGDGYVVAKKLYDAGWNVKVIQLIDDNPTTQTAKNAKQKWLETREKIYSYDHNLLENIDICIDAIFGIGLTRDIKGDLAEIINNVNSKEFMTLSIDIASGINADTGQMMGVAISPAITVTFHQAKPGHIVQPGKFHTGELIIAKIGILTKKE